jgi:hypothetical protein
MNTTPITDETCSAFEQIPADLDSNAIHRFVVGNDAAPAPMTADEAEAELGDPFATLLLLAGSFPRTAEELLAGIDAATPDDDPLRGQMSFLLGEGSQLPGAPDAPGTNRGMRFLIARGGAPAGIDLLVSASFPDRGLIEVMAWDRRSGGFNYYRNVGAGSAWAFAGNSRHALEPGTAGKGPFESHPTGNLLMKELKFPWLHWHSPAANIFAEVFEPDDSRRTHGWFVDKLGADVAEQSVAIPSIDRWTSARFAALVAEDGSVSDPQRVVEQVVGTGTVNLVTSRASSSAVTPDDTVDLPPTFFVDADALAGPQLGLAAPPEFSVSGALYLAALEEFNSALVETGSGFRHPPEASEFADTHFAFAVPERAFEDQSATSAAIDAGLLTRRLVASLLMVDFPNPVFSARRAALLAHAPAEARIEGGASTYSTEMADRIVAAADAAGGGSPEREFADLWSAGEDFVDPFNARLRSYYDAVSALLGTEEGYFDVVRLAESRRQAVRAMPIGGEFDLLFATLSPDTAPLPLRMSPSGSVEEVV